MQFCDEKCCFSLLLLFWLKNTFFLQIFVVYCFESVICWKIRFQLVFTSGFYGLSGFYMFSPRRSPGKNGWSWGVLLCWESIKSAPGADQTPAPLLNKEPPPPELPKPPHMSAPDEELVLEVKPPIDWEVWGTETCQTFRSMEQNSQNKEVWH